MDNLFYYFNFVNASAFLLFYEVSKRQPLQTAQQQKARYRHFHRQPSVSFF